MNTAFKTVQAGNLKTRLKVAFAFFKAGFRTFFGTQEFELNSVAKLSKKEYEAAKRAAFTDLLLGEDTKRGDISAVIRF